MESNRVVQIICTTVPSKKSQGEKMQDTFNIAGVSFNNTDGTSRQEALKSFGDGCFVTINLLKEPFFNQDTQTTELAIACVEKTTKKRLGFIPRAHILPEIMNERQMTGLVRFYEPEGTWYCELARVQQPDSKMYADMKIYCETNGLPMPAYDIRAYISLLDAAMSASC
jgi:hypothetical protein